MYREISNTQQNRALIHYIRYTCKASSVLSYYLLAGIWPKWLAIQNEVVGPSPARNLHMSAKTLPSERRRSLIQYEHPRQRKALERQFGISYPCHDHRRGWEIPSAVCIPVSDADVVIGRSWEALHITSQVGPIRCLDLAAGRRFLEPSAPE
jgi:hypothetical protein